MKNETVEIRICVKNVPKEKFEQFYKLISEGMAKIDGGQIPLYYNRIVKLNWEEFEKIDLLVAIRDVFSATFSAESTIEKAKKDRLL